MQILIEGHGWQQPANEESQLADGCPTVQAAEQFLLILSSTHKGTTETNCGKAGSADRWVKL